MVSIAQLYSDFMILVGLNFYTKAEIDDDFATKDYVDEAIGDLDDWLTS